LRGDKYLKRIVNTKTLPFIILLVIHTGLLIYTFCKNKNQKSLFVLLLSNIGFAYFFEFFILNLFQSYQYKPKLFKKNYLDNILGAFFSQGVFLPFTSIFISSFGFGWKIKVMFGIYFAIVERIFIKLGIFRNNWWRTLYTVLLIPLYFKISDFWYKNLLKGTPINLFFSFFMMTWVTGLSLLNILGVVRKVRFGLGRFYTWKEHFILSTLYWFMISLFTTYSIYKNSNWQGKLVSFLIMKHVDWFLVKMGIVKAHLHNLLFMNALQIGMIYISVIYKDWVYSGQYGVSADSPSSNIRNSTNTKG
jgi:hypothetical protein